MINTNFMDPSSSKLGQGGIATGGFDPMPSTPRHLVSSILQRSQENDVVEQVDIHCVLELSISFFSNVNVF
jgi:hypothetical protein